MDNKGFSRRFFLRAGMMAGLIPTGLKAIGKEDVFSSTAPQPSALNYVRLGRTELMISEVSFGASRLRDGEENLVRHALDRDVNYFDTAESYTGSSSEKVLGNALKGVRDKVYIATKTFCGNDTSAQTLMGSLESSLQRLKTDYVDIFFNHAVNDVTRLENPEWMAFIEKAREQGKLRFSGMSGHAGRLADCLTYGLDQDMFDVILVATNFGEDPAFYENFTQRFDMVATQPALPGLMQKAKSKDVGVIAMKVLRGGKLNDMKPFEKGGATFSQAALRWILNNAHVDAAIISMTEESRIDEYLLASGGLELAEADIKLLQQYMGMHDIGYCRPACDDCESACPYGVGIADVLRTRMYAVDYGDPAFARSEYQMLAKDAAACLSCDGQACQNACTYKLPIAGLCAFTHEMLA